MFMYTLSAQIITIKTLKLLQAPICFDPVRVIFREHTKSVYNTDAVCDGVETCKNLKF